MDTDVTTCYTDVMPPHKESIKWYRNVIEGMEADGDTDGIECAHRKYCEVVEKVSAFMAKERSVMYSTVVKHAISHKIWQIFHRVLKKKTYAMARPVSKKRMETTDDQHHAEEQITQLLSKGKDVNNPVWWEEHGDPNPKPKRSTSAHRHPGQSEIPTVNRQAESSPCDDVIQVTDEEICRLRKIIRSFSNTSAVAHKRPPRLLDQLVDDDTLLVLIRLFERCEKLGK